MFLSLSLSEAALELFGSSANGFGSYDSDVDLCLILNEEYTVREHTKYYNKNIRCNSHRKLCYFLSVENFMLFNPLYCWLTRAY